MRASFRQRAPVYALTLALVALAKTYGKSLEYSGPVVESVRIEKKGALRVAFSHAEGGLKLAGNAKAAAHNRPFRK